MAGVLSAAIIFGALYLEPYVGHRIPRWLLLLGDASYVLYIFHPLFAPLIPTIFQKVGIRNFTFTVLTSMLFALAIGVLIHLYIERPVTRKLTQVFRRHLVPA
jgi:peptidoglycan/LPS O-acetylase OafA/YrhL